MKNLENNSFFSSNRYFWFFYILAVATGCFWRLYFISDQILLDDEWHALNFSISHSLWYLLTHFTYAGANIIPLNAYVRILLDLSGWSEINLILPSLIAGIASLLMFPLVLKRTFSPRVTVFFAFLLAFSPILIFYSRVCRPYSIYNFLGFLCIWVLYEWGATRKKRYGFIFAIAGILCVYFHFAGTIFVFVPLGFAIILKMAKKHIGWPVMPEQGLPDITDLIAVGCGISLCLAVLLSAPILNWMPATNVSPADFSIHSVLGFMKIVSGTSDLFINIFFYTLVVLGLFGLLKKSFLLGAIFIGVFIAYLFVALVTRSNFANVPLVACKIYHSCGLVDLFSCGNWL
jgi:hypothetical protein